MVTRTATQILANLYFTDSYAYARCDYAWSVALANQMAVPGPKGETAFGSAMNILVKIAQDAWGGAPVDEAAAGTWYRAAMGAGTLGADHYLKSLSWRHR